MDVIPFNVPGLPEPEALTGEFVVRPVAIDTSDSQAGPMLGLHAAPTPAPAAPPLSDGVLCIYPGTDMISYLFSIQVRSGQKDLNPGILVYSASVEGSCTLFSLSYDINANPVLVVTILPEEYLSKILTTTNDGTTIVDVSGVDDRLEFTQVFAGNAFGAIKRLSNELTHVPKERGNTVFDLQDDLDIISDVCSFYLTRSMVLSGQAATATKGETAAAVGVDPIWRLLWKPAGAMGIIGFSVVFILTRTSVSYRNLNGNFRIDYNRGANPLPQNPGQNQGN